jgi:hypothetical protein
MTDRITVCRRCSVPFVHVNPQGNQPVYCPACRKQKGPTQVKCQRCSEYWTWQPLAGHRVPILCPRCQMTHKRCVGCGRIAPLANFNVHRTNLDGRQCRCRTCLSRPPKTYRCGFCHVSFSRSSRGGPNPAQRKHLCDSCEPLYKWCATCDEILLHSAFSNSVGRRDGKVSRCKRCQSRKTATDKTKQYQLLTLDQRKQRLISKYGMTVADWNAMFIEQDGRCAVCGRKHEDSPHGLVVDHCHDSGGIRALLCGLCNTAIGSMRDDATLLRVAADYLDKYRVMFKQLG